MKHSFSSCQTRRNPAPPPGTAFSRRRDKQPSAPRNPLQDLNGAICHPAQSINPASSSTSSLSSSHSSTSIDAPRGCLRFFLSNSSSTRNFSAANRAGSPINKAPKSAPTKARPSKLSLRNEASPKPGFGESSRGTRQQRLRRNPPCLYQWQSGKKSASKAGKRSGASFITVPDGKARSELLAGSGSSNPEASELSLHKLSDPAITPVCRSEKIEENSSGGKIKTPPIQASVSPEIQGGSTSMKHSGPIAVAAGTPALYPCYGAGHLVSGVTDRRKCRPRGILCVRNDSDVKVGEKFSDNVDSNDNDDGGCENFNGVTGRCYNVSPIPLPCGASMHWLLSPCNEEDEDQRNCSETETYQFKRPVFDRSDSVCSPNSSSLGPVFSSDLGNRSNMTSTTTGTSIDTSKISNPKVASPGRCLEFQGFLGPSNCKGDIFPLTDMTPICKNFSPKEERRLSYGADLEAVTFSLDSLGRGNIVQTPNSDSPPCRHTGLSWFNTKDSEKHQTEHELDLMAELFSNTTLSPEHTRYKRDPTNLNYQLDCLTSSSNSIDLARVQDVLDSKLSWVSNSTLDNLSQSQLRISWRDGLVSRIFEMDEYDICKCLSDEDDATSCSTNLQHNQRFKHNGDTRDNASENDVKESTLLLNQVGIGKQETGQKGKDKCSTLRRSQSAESLCFAGEGLITSGDSTWNLCYKNRLFDV